MASMLNPSNHRPEQPYALVVLKQLVRRHPLACLSGLWVSLVLLGSLATIGLFNPSLTEQQESNPSPTLETIQEPTPQSKAHKDLPWAFFGVVALGCAGGSLLVTQALRKVAERRYSAKQSKPVVTVRKKTQNTAKKRLSVPRTPKPVPSHQYAPSPSLSNSSRNDSSRNATPLTPTTDGWDHRPSYTGIDNKQRVSSTQLSTPKFQLSEVRPPSSNRAFGNGYVEQQSLRGNEKAYSGRAVPVKPISHIPNNQPATTTENLTYVTVLPPEASHPLDGRTESLADLLDLRKHHSLTSLMRNKSLL